MSICDTKKSHDELHDVIDKAFAKFPEGCILTPDMMAVVKKDIVEYFEKKIIGAMHLKEKKNK